MDEKTKKTDKRSVISGFRWRFSERIGAQLVTLFVSTYLKYLLGPEQYGTINLVTIFITLANVFVTKIKIKLCKQNLFDNNLSRRNTEKSAGNKRQIMLIINPPI